jgi:hypothetical protein
MMETVNASETSVVTRATWRNIPQDAILHAQLEIAAEDAYYEKSTGKFRDVGLEKGSSTP